MLNQLITLLMGLKSVINFPHQTISFIKSGLRITGYLGLIGVAIAPLSYWTYFWYLGWGLLVVSESVGIWEEIGHE